MPFTVHVLYPVSQVPSTPPPPPPTNPPQNNDDLKFDMSYYLKTHMPLVFDKWKQYGLQKWDIIEYGPGLDGSKPQYRVCAVLHWDNADEVKTAAGSEEAKPVFGDIANFTNAQPTFLMGSVVGSS